MKALLVAGARPNFMKVALFGRGAGRRGRARGVRRGLSLDRAVRV